MAGYIFLGILVLFVIVVIVFYNAIINAYNAVKRAWADVLTQERQRGRIIPELEKVLQQHTDYESDLQTKITQLRQGIDALDEQLIDPQQQREVSMASKELLKSIHVAVENYPDLQASQSFAKYMDEITNQEDNVGAALRIFNQNVEEYNATLERFPSNIINNVVTKKEIIHVFHDESASQSFDYKPNFD